MRLLTFVLVATACVSGFAGIAWLLWGRRE